MDQNLARFQRQLITNAQILFKFSLGISATRPKLGYLASFASYRHTANEEDLKLARKDEFFAADLLEHVATYVLAVQIDTALEALYPSRFKSADQIVRSASTITRLIRNAFAHNPFAPIWIIDRKAANKQFTVPDPRRLSQFAAAAAELRSPTKRGRMASSPSLSTSVPFQGTIATVRR
jgi:hypothetical protein